jgi:uncharacterized membrane protein SirB2
MDLSIIALLISLFILLISTILTQMLHAKRWDKIYRIIFFLNAMLFIAGISLFVLADNVFYMIGGTLLSLGILVVTAMKYTDF